MTGMTRLQRLSAGSRTPLLAAATGAAALLIAVTQLTADAALGAGAPTGPVSVGSDSLPVAARVAPSLPHAEVTIAAVSAPVLVSQAGAGQTTGPSQSSAGQPGDGQDLGTFLVTCYDLRGTTADGDQAGPQSVAVDPSVIPLGTKIDIQGVGWRTADDTGGAVRGHHVDIWEPSQDQCAAFGRQYLDVHRAA